MERLQWYSALLTDPVPIQLFSSSLRFLVVVELKKPDEFVWSNYLPEDMTLVGSFQRHSNGMLHHLLPHLLKINVNFIKHYDKFFGTTRMCDKTHEYDYAINCRNCNSIDKSFCDCKKLRWNISLFYQKFQELRNFTLFLVSPKFSNSDSYTYIVADISELWTNSSLI